MISDSFPGARLTKAYDVTIHRYRCPLKFNIRCWTLTPENMHFTSCWKIDDDILELWHLKLSETVSYNYGSIQFGMKHIQSSSRMAIKSLPYDYHLSIWLDNIR